MTKDGVYACHSCYDGVVSEDPLDNGSWSCDNCEYHYKEELMNNPHPAAIAAQKLAEANAAKNSEERQAVQQQAAELGLRFMHIRNYSTRLDQPESKGGATLAYRFEGPNRVSVAVATCHTNDLYSKPSGRKYATDSFAKGRYVTLRITKGMTPTHFLSGCFQLAGQVSDNI